VTVSFIREISDVEEVMGMTRGERAGGGKIPLARIAPESYILPPVAREAWISLATAPHATSGGSAT